MERLTLAFEPLDVLQFRDHRPFDAGRHAEAHGRFPLPSVFRGALRTALLRRAGADFSRASWERFRANDPLRGWLGNPDDPGTLRLGAPLLVRGLDRAAPEPLFPVPADLPWPERLSPEKLDGIGGLVTAGLGDLGGRALPWSREAASKPKAPSGVWLTSAGLVSWFAGQRATAGMVDGKTVCAVERRTGNARDPASRTVADAMLYTVDTWRFAAHAGFAVEVWAPGQAERAALLGLDRQTLQLGGKGHRARIRVYEGAVLTGGFPPPAAGRVRGILLASLVGPERADTSGWSLAVPQGARLQALVRAGEPPHPAGGFDLHRQAPKPLRTTLSAGTVLELDGVAHPDALGDHAWGQDPEHHLAGHGAAIFGGMNP